LNRHKGAMLGGLTAIVFLVFLPLGLSDYYVSVLLDLLMWSALTASWIILSGYTGYISLAHSAFFGLGAYFMAMTWTHLPYIVGLYARHLHSR
jgi:branched-chain amino acid transport system permease protein